MPHFLFSDPKTRPTALDRAMEKMERSFATYTPTERENAVGLLDSILKYTGNKDLARLAEDLIPLLGLVVPMIGQADVGMVLARTIAKVAPRIQTEVVRQIGWTRWYDLQGKNGDPSAMR